MAWLQVHQTLKDHRKLFDAADQLEVEPPHMMGLLVSFWLWALDNAPTGSLVDITPRMISRAAQWDGDPEKLAKTLIRAGWIDEKEDGTLEIHDWYEYAGKLIDQRQAEKERSRSRRAAAAASADASPDDQTPTAGRPANSRKKAGGRVDQSREDKTREGNTPPSPSDEGSDGGAKSLVEVRFLEFWKAYCHPYRPSERGSNENQNGLIRRHLPKGTDLSTISYEETKRIEDWLNNYPRKMFGYLCSEQLFREEIALILAS